MPGDSELEADNMYVLIFNVVAVESKNIFHNNMQRHSYGNIYTIVMST